MFLIDKYSNFQLGNLGVIYLLLHQYIHHFLIHRFSHHSHIRVTKLHDHFPFPLHSLCEAVYFSTGRWGGTHLTAGRRITLLKRDSVALK